MSCHRPESKWEGQVQTSNCTHDICRRLVTESSNLKLHFQIWMGKERNQMILKWLGRSTGACVETWIWIPTLSRMIQLAAVAWSGHLTVLCSCFSRLCPLRHPNTRT